MDQAITCWLPSYVSLAAGPTGNGRGPMFRQEGAAWGKQHDPFFHGSDDGKVSLPELKSLNGFSWTRLADLNRLHTEFADLRQILDTSNPQKWTFIRPQAYGLLNSMGSRQALDLSEESNKIRTRHGHTSFDQSALRGGRLVEAINLEATDWKQ